MELMLCLRVLLALASGVSGAKQLVRSNTANRSGWGHRLFDLLNPRFWAASAPSDKYGRKIAVALLVCSLGDGFLEVRDEWPEHERSFFLAGLVSFLVGHVLFIPAFCPSPGFHMLTDQPLVTAIALGYASAFYAYLLPNLPSALRVPMLVYALGLALMFLAACARSRALAGCRGGSLAAFGALSFLVSDSVLASNKFVAPLPHSKMAIMVTYYVAQGLITASAAYNPDTAAQKSDASHARAPAQ